MKIEVTRATARGQVVIPQDVRKEMGIEEGTQFLVYTEDDAIILKPALKEFEKVLAPLRRKFKSASLAEKDIEEEIQAYRREKYAKGSS